MEIGKRLEENGMKNGKGNTLENCELDEGHDLTKTTIHFLFYYNYLNNKDLEHFFNITEKYCMKGSVYPHTKLKLY